MKLTLVQPFYHNTWESMSCGFLASYCKKNYQGKLDIDFFHGNFDNDDIIVQGCLNSDFVGFSCTSPTFSKGVALAKRIKSINNKVRIIFGGHHVSALGNSITDDVIDHVVIGEGEQALLEILNGKRDRIIHGSKIDFQNIPWIDRDVIKNDRTIQLCYEMIGERIASFQANRGCPHRCAFCSERNITGIINKDNPIRSRNIDDVLSEIESVVSKYKLDKFKFVDATFDWSAKYVIDFCKRKIDRGITTPWECMVHASSAQEEMFPWLKKSNCYQINIGCESGSPKILKVMKKGTTIEQIAKVFQWAKNSDIERRAFFLLGMPEETEEDIKMTDALVQQIQPDFFGITLLCPYPGSDYYDYAKYKDIEWDKTDEYANDFWYTDHFSNFQLKEWQKHLVNKNKDRLCARQKV